jgi:glutathione S-transferase
MPKEYTVKYFGVNGRGSAICMMLAKAGADWEKVTLTGEEWGALKPTLPAGSGLPLV